MSVVAPIDRYFERQNVKGFGLLVDAPFHERNRAIFPNNGLPNQFTGYHAGVDVEYTAPVDQTREVPVRAIADGQVVYVGDVAGYGGLIIVRHAAPEPITSLYGHVRLVGRQVNRGDAVKAGQALAFLGNQYSRETSGARRHLHFGIHKGVVVDVGGHEPSLAALNREWYNPNDWLERFGARPVQAAPPSPDPKPSLTPSPRPTPSAEPTPSPLLPLPDPSPESSLWRKVIDFLTGLFN